MQGNSEGGTKISVQGAASGLSDDAALAALCAAFDRAVQAYRPERLRIREIVVTLEEKAPSLGTSDTAPVYVDVYDSGYGHGI